MTSKNEQKQVGKSSTEDIAGQGDSKRISVEGGGSQSDMKGSREKGLNAERNSWGKSDKAQWDKEMQTESPGHGLAANRGLAIKQSHLRKSELNKISLALICLEDDTGEA